MNFLFCEIRALQTPMCTNENKSFVPIREHRWCIRAFVAIKMQAPKVRNKDYRLL